MPPLRQQRSCPFLNKADHTFIHVQEVIEPIPVVLDAEQAAFVAPIASPVEEISNEPKVEQVASVESTVIPAVRFLASVTGHRERSGEVLTARTALTGRRVAGASRAGADC